MSKYIKSCYSFDLGNNFILYKTIDFLRLVSIFRESSLVIKEIQSLSISFTHSLQMIKCFPFSLLFESHSVNWFSINVKHILLCYLVILLHLRFQFVHAFPISRNESWMQSISLHNLLTEVWATETSNSS